MPIFSAFLQEAYRGELDKAGSSLLRLPVFASPGHRLVWIIYIATPYFRAMELVETITPTIETNRVNYHYLRLIRWRDFVMSLKTSQGKNGLEMIKMDQVCQTGE